MRCSNCGKKLQGNELYCRNCQTETARGKKERLYIQKIGRQTQKMLEREKREAYREAYGEPSKKFVVFALILYFALLLLFLFGFFAVRDFANGATENGFLNALGSIMYSIGQKLNNLPDILRIIVNIIIIFIPVAIPWAIFLFFFHAERSLHRRSLEDLDNAADEAQKTALEFAESDPYTITFDSTGTGHIHGGAPSHQFTFTGFFNFLLNVILFFLSPIIFPFDAIRWLITHR